MGAFRTALAASFLYKFFLSACTSLADASSGAADSKAEGGQFGWLGTEERSALAAVAEGVPRGVQFHADAKPNEIVGQAERHRAAHLQARCFPFVWKFPAELGNSSWHRAVQCSGCYTSQTSSCCPAHCAPDVHLAGLQTMCGAFVPAPVLVVRLPVPPAGVQRSLLRRCVPLKLWFCGRR